jgi:prepilin-type N-terminal cleavage/methylation domain-containing protein
MQLNSRRARGFSLAEIAVVMVIVGLLIGGLLAPLSAQMEQRNYADTQKRLESAAELLLGFAIANGRLPCPASTSSAGDESPNGGGTCSNYYDGFLPAKALGMQPVDSSGYAIDAFNGRIRYVLAKTFKTGTACAGALPAFSSSTNIKSNGLQCLPGDLRVCSSSQFSGFTATNCDTGSGTDNDLVGPNTVVAIVFSTGKNSAVTDATRLDELANTDGNATFVSHTPTPAGAAGGEFDDQVVWISTGLLYGRMVSAGILP